jgi:hypothetical protein
MNSATYQRSAEANTTNEKDTRYFSKYNIRRLPAEVLLDTMSQVTGVPTEFRGYPQGTRALQLPDTLVQSHFLTAFGRPPRILINGDTLNTKLRDDRSSIARLIDLGFSDSRIVEYLTLAAFSRNATEDEKARLTRLIQDEREKTRGDSHEVRRHALEDLLWAMLTSKEFLFNH